MNYRSIQFVITSLVGLISFIFISGLTIYILLTGLETQSLVERKVYANLESMVKQNLISVIEKPVVELQKNFQLPITITRTLAETTLQMGRRETGQSPPASSMSRQELSDLLRAVLLANPSLLSLYSGWEPGAFDDRDSAYINQIDAGYDHTGRFMPWWYRVSDDQLLLEPLVAAEMESHELLPTGVRAGEYYLCPKETRKICVVDPAPYPIDGKEVLMSSFNIPLLLDGEFLGIIGSDLSLEFIQSLLQDIHDDLYDGAGELALIAHNGRLIASTRNPEALGEDAQPWLGITDLQGIRQHPMGDPLYRIQSETDQHDEEMIEVFVNLSLDRDSDSIWTLALILPLEVAMADFFTMQQELSAISGLDQFTAQYPVMQ